MIRTALLYLAIGATVGGLLLAEKALRVAPWLWLLRSGHIHLLLVGWMVQLACGVAIWILPRFDSAGSRGPLGFAWLCYGALNASVWLVALQPPLVNAAGQGPTLWMSPLAGALQVVALAALVAHLWRRVLPFGLSSRRAGPER
jgi:hypothetical protein